MIQGLLPVPLLREKRAHVVSHLITVRTPTSSYLLVVVVLAVASGLFSAFGLARDADWTARYWSLHIKNPSSFYADTYQEQNSPDSALSSLYSSHHDAILGVAAVVVVVRSGTQPISRVSFNPTSRARNLAGLGNLPSATRFRFSLATPKSIFIVADTYRRRFFQSRWLLRLLQTRLLCAVNFSFAPPSSSNELFIKTFVGSWTPSGRLSQTQSEHLRSDTERFATLTLTIQV